MVLCKKRNTRSNLSRLDTTMELRPSTAELQLTALDSFTFSKETCSDDFNKKALKTFLVERGLYWKGLWKHVCSKTMSRGLKFGTMARNEQPFVLPLESAILDLPLSEALSLRQPVENWLQYYKLRGFEMDSPIAGVLDYPLTLYWIITNFLARLYPSSIECIEQSGSMCVHVIGVEKEADMFPAFQELGRLMAPLKLQLHLFGDEISKQLDGYTRSLDNVSFQLHSKLYHECDLQHQKPPDLVLGFNAGLSAYPSFMQTVLKIVGNETPFFCTDYCYESAFHSKTTLEEFRVGQVCEISRNPFHGPFRIDSQGLEYPCFSNAFVFSVKNSM